MNDEKFHGVVHLLWPLELAGRYVHERIPRTAKAFGPVSAGVRERNAHRMELDYELALPGLQLLEQQVPAHQILEDVVSATDVSLVW